jgi:hypothetical protein
MKSVQTGLDSMSLRLKGKGGGGVGKLMGVSYISLIDMEKKRHMLRSRQ